MADDSENDVKGPLAEICAYFVMHFEFGWFTMPKSDANI